MTTEKHIPVFTTDKSSVYIRTQCENCGTKIAYDIPKTKPPKDKKKIFWRGVQAIIILIIGWVLGYATSVIVEDVP